MKKLFLAIALISFIGLINVEAAPCEDGKCTKKECTSKKGKTEHTEHKTAEAAKKSCSSKEASKSCCASKAKASTSDDKLKKVEDKKVD
ncbi:MAG: hypothetical protein RQ875_11050 [Vicingaceae bacterium]|nr:hypothetical protein [Vicingaceae bacterium]